eukprot:9279531-Pyramimonas_sp.AAC.1
MDAKGGRLYSEAPGESPRTKTIGQNSQPIERGQVGREGSRNRLPRTAFAGSSSLLGLPNSLRYYVLGDPLLLPRGQHGAKQ